MRNIAQFPITADEVKETLFQQIESYNGIIGGLQPAILGAILEVLGTQLDKDLTVMDLVLDQVNV